VAVTSHSTVEQFATQQDGSVKDDKIIPGGKFYTASKPETVGISVSNFCAESSSVDGSHTDLGSLGFSVGKTHTELMSAAADNCMDMSVDEHRNFAAEKPDRYSETVKDKFRSGPESGLLQTLTHELMDGSFRDESRSCHGNNSPCNSLPTSGLIPAAKADSLQPFVNTASSATQNQTKSTGLAESCGDKKAQGNPCVAATVGCRGVPPAAEADCFKSIIDNPSVENVTSATKNHVKSEGLPEPGCDMDTQSKSVCFSGAPASLAKADCFRSAADEHSVKSMSSAREYHTKDDESAETGGHVDGKPASHLISFSDVAEKVIAPQFQSSRSEVNDSYTYRDQSAILISDDDDDDTGDKTDKGDNEIGDFLHPNTGLESGGSLQKPTSKANVKDTASKIQSESKLQTIEFKLSSAYEVCEAPELKPVLGAQEKDTSSKTLLDHKLLQTSKSELSSVNKVCQPSTVITVRQPPTSLSSAHTVRPPTISTSSALLANGLASNIDMKKAVARRETISKLLNQKKVGAFIIYLCIYLFIYLLLFIYVII